jgi:hypothetical protein
VTYRREPRSMVEYVKVMLNTLEGKFIRKVYENQ